MEKTIKMDKKVKIMLYAVTITLIVIGAYVFKSTYAVFETEANGEADFQVGSWIIKLNEIDISSGQTVNFTINSFVYTENSHVKNGCIAPGRSGYFDVILDPSGTDVAVRYDITLDIDGEYEDNILYYITTEDGSMIRSNVNTYSGVIDLDSIDNGDVATLRVNLEWNNNSSYNESDTELGIVRNNSISIPAQINVVQYLGETITEYVEPLGE